MKHSFKDILISSHLVKPAGGGGGGGGGGSSHSVPTLFTRLFSLWFGDFDFIPHNGKL